MITTVYVLLMQYGDEPIYTGVYTSHDEAAKAIRLVAKREHSNLVTGLARPPLATAACIAMLTRYCGYGSVRLVEVALNLEPGDYPEPVDLYPSLAPSEAIPA